MTTHCTPRTPAYLLLFTFLHVTHDEVITPVTTTTWFNQIRSAARRHEVCVELIILYYTGAGRWKFRPRGLPRVQKEKTTEAFRRDAYRCTFFVDVYPLDRFLCVPALTWERFSSCTNRSAATDPVHHVVSWLVRATRLRQTPKRGYRRPSSRLLLFTDG